MRAESFGAVHAISPKGGMGLMQIMLATWAGLRHRCRLGADPYDAYDNIVAGATYLRKPHDRCGVPDFLAAYSAVNPHRSSSRSVLRTTIGLRI